jgi:hypothetical protein
MAQTFKHNKKRSTGIVYEMLVRRLSQAMIDRNRGDYNTSLGIVKKYFGDGTVLGIEKELFDVIRNTRGITETAARRVLHEVQAHASKLDWKKIDIKKSNLIKEINYSFGKDFFAEHRVPDYRFLATVQILIDMSRSGRTLTESVQKIQLEEVLVRYMTSTAAQISESKSKEEIDQLVMSLVAKRFNEKYSQSLNKPQQVLLEKYIRAQVAGDEKQLTDYLLREGQRIFKAIDGVAFSKEVRSDKLMSERLQEARTKLSEVLVEITTHGKLDAPVESMMLFQKLVEEIEADE